MRLRLRSGEAAAKSPKSGRGFGRPAAEPRRRSLLPTLRLYWAEAERRPDFKAPLVFRCEPRVPGQQISEESGAEVRISEGSTLFRQIFKKPKNQASPSNNSPPGSNPQPGGFQAQEKGDRISPKRKKNIPSLFTNFNDSVTFRRRPSRVQVPKTADDPGFSFRSSKWAAIKGSCPLRGTLAGVHRGFSGCSL